GDKLGFRLHGVESGVARATRTGIRLADHRDALDLVSGERRKLVVDRIGRLIVDDDDVEIGEGLGKDGGQCAPEDARLLLVIRNDNCQLRHLFAPAVYLKEVTRSPPIWLPPLQG